MLGDNEEVAERSVPERMPANPGRGAVIPAERNRGYGAYEWFGEEQRDETSVDLQKYLRILRKHWLWIAAVVIVALAVGVATTLLTTRIYTATTTIQIDREPAQVGTMQTVQQREFSSDDEFFQTQFALLKSRELAIRTIDKFDMANDQGIIQGLGLGKPDKNGRRPSGAVLRTQLISTLQTNLNVFQVQRSRLVRISFDSPSPQTSAKIANAIAAEFIEWNLARRFKAGDYSRDFLRVAMEAEKVNVETADRDLAAYADSHKIINIGGGSGAAGEKGSAATQGASTTIVGSNLLAANAAWTQAKAARFRAEVRWKASQQPNAAIPEVMDNLTIQTYKQSLAGLNAEYQQKATVFRENFPDMVALKARMDNLSRTIDTATEEVKASLKSAYDSALKEEQEAQAAVEALQGSFLGQNREGIEYGLKQMAADTTRAQYESLLGQFREASVAGGITTNNISQIDSAQPPHFPSRPAPKKNLITAGLIGLALGVALAFLLEYLDESIRVPEDVERKLGLPLLGTVPKLDRGVSPAEAMVDVRSPLSESYYSVRTALQFSTDEGVPSSLLVTSARPAEGKSTSAVAIAQNFARLGLRVLLVDGDLRNPSLHRTLEVENSTGLSNYLTGGLPLARVVQPTSMPCLSFIPCGPLPPNPAELLAGTRVEMLLREARAEFDIVVVDGPPIMGLADAPLLASAVSGTMIAIEAGGTGRNLARVALRRLNVGAPHILGVLLTKFDAKKSSYGYGYGYAYDYAYGNKPQIKAGN